jgi:methyl-accepting chemotaxis protein
MAKKSKDTEGARPTDARAAANEHSWPEPQGGSKRFSAAAASVARIAGRAPKSLMKTSDLNTGASAPRRAQAAAPVPSPPGRAHPRKKFGAAAESADRQQKIEERVAAATEELAGGLTEAASAAEELR